MDNFDPYNVLLAIATNIPVLLMTVFVLQGMLFSSGHYTRIVGFSVCMHNTARCLCVFIDHITGEAYSMGNFFFSSYQLFITTFHSNSWDLIAQIGCLLLSLYNSLKDRNTCNKTVFAGQFW